MHSEPDDSELGGQTLLNGDSSTDFVLSNSSPKKAGDSTVGPGKVPDTVFYGEKPPAPPSNGNPVNPDLTLPVLSGDVSNDLTIAPPSSGGGTMGPAPTRAEPQ